MPILSIDELKARLALTKIKGRTGNFLRLDPDKPVICHILPGNDSLWFRQTATHWLGKNKINCANPDGEGAPCYICERIKEQKEELAAAMKEHEGDSPEEAAENAGVFSAVDEAIRKVTARRLFAFNVLVRGEENPKLFEAPWMIFNAIYTMFNSAVNDYAMDITDPHASIPFTLLRTGSGKNGTRYSASPAPKSMPLFANARGQCGPEEEAKIETVLSKMVNLDEQYKCPEKTELINAWNAYAGGEEVAGAKPEPPKFVPPPRPTTSPVAPPSMSRIGGKTAAKPAPMAKPPEPEPVTEDINGSVNGETDEPGEELAPAAVPTKHQAAAASNKLLGRLKGKK